MKVVSRNLILFSVLVAILQAQSPQTPKQSSPSPSIQTGDIRTIGACSPVLVGPAKPITIECNTVGLSKDEIKNQAQQYAAILSSVRESGLKEDQILNLVRQIALGVNRISEATQPRSITEAQRGILIERLNKVSDTNILIDVQAGADNRFFGEDFITLFTKNLSWKSAHAKFGIGEVPTRGVYFIVSKEDNDAHTVTDGCVLAAESLLELHLIDEIQGLSIDSLSHRQGEHVLSTSEPENWRRRSKCD